MWRIVETYACGECDTVCTIQMDSSQRQKFMEIEWTTAKPKWKWNGWLDKVLIRTHIHIHMHNPHYREIEQFILFKMLYTHYLYPVKLSMNQFFCPTRSLPTFHSMLESMNRTLPAMCQPPSHLNTCDDISCGCEIESREEEKRKKYIKINVLSTKLMLQYDIFSAVCLWLPW